MKSFFKFLTVSSGWAEAEDPPGGEDGGVQLPAPQDRPEDARGHPLRLPLHSCRQVSYGSQDGLKIIPM